MNTSESPPMTDTAELIARLRDAEVGYRPHVVGKYLAEAADALSSLVRERDEARRVLRDHHKWHAESGILGIPDGDGGWIEMDNGAEYADSRLCQRTEETLRDMPPEFVVPPRGGWAMGSNHWENWQLAYRQKRAAEAERDEARAAHDADAKAFLVAIARVEAAEADAARMREALKPFAEAANDYDPEEGDDKEPAWLETFKVGDLRRARNALGGKDE